MCGAIKPVLTGPVCTVYSPYAILPSAASQKACGCSSIWLHIVHLPVFRLIEVFTPEGYGAPMKSIRVRTESLVAELKKLRLFRLLPDDAVRKLIECSEFVECEPGETFITEHAVETDVYVILSGSCAVMVDQEGHQSYISTLGTGQVVGEAAIFSNMPRTASVVAQDPVRLMRFERKGFVRTLQEDRNAGMKVLFMMMHNLLSKLREVNLELAFERAEDVGQADVDSFIETLIDGESASQ